MITTTVIRSILTSYRTGKVGDGMGTRGHGLFATSSIAKNELIAILGGSLYSAEELKSLPVSLRERSIPLDENNFLVADSEEFQSLTGRIHHSCEPNMGFSGPNSLVAIRDIFPGEELTFDYSMAFTEMSDFTCNCGSSNCRNTVHADDHMRPMLRSKYRGRFTQWLEQQHQTIGDSNFFLEEFNASGAWGLVTALDLHNCNPETIRSADKIYEFTVELCDRIKVNRFGEPVIVNFGADERVAGYSLVQLIETSLVSGHFANLTNRVYLDIFSCAYYDPHEMTEFSKEFFQSDRANVNIYLRY